MTADGASRIREAVQHIKQRFPRLIELYDNTASLLDRTVATGIVRPELARQFGAPGYVGRASGRNFDARKSPGYPPYDTLEFAVPVLTAGDVDARVWVRIREVEQSLGLIEQILDRMPEGPIVSPLSNTAAGEGLGFAEGFRGDVLVWVRIDGGHIARCHLRDPSWFQWPLLEAAIEGNIVADFPLCNKSFNCSYSGHDLVMRRTLFESLTHGPLTEKPPLPDDAALAELAANVDRAARRRLGRSLSIREVDAGSCNGCELEIHALNNAFYDLERFGLRFVASPRHADVLLVTGPVTRNMRQALERTYNATPDPKWVVAVGACAADGGLFAGSYGVVGGVNAVVPVDLHIAGCPPSPLQLLKGLLALLDDGKKGR